MRILSWCKANAVLSISLLAALITACIVHPDRDYAGYYDIKTLVCLFSVLAVVGALRDMQVFAALSQRMVRTFRTVRSVCTALVIVTMFGSKPPGRKSTPPCSLFCKTAPQTSAV